MKILSIANAKGGVGKSSVAVNIADGLARAGERVLLVDLDPQGSASWMLTGTASHEVGTAEVILRERIFPGSYVPVEGREHLVLMPCSDALLELDPMLSARMGGELAMARVFRDLEWVHAFDYAVIDCPPTLAVSVVGALYASDGVITPVTASVLSLAGLDRMEGMIKRIRKTFDGKVRLLGAVLVDVDEREGITEEVRQTLRASSSGRLFETEVRTNTRAKAMAKRTAFDAGDPKGKEDYSALIKEMCGRLERKR